MNALARLEHGDELRQPAGARLGPLGVLQAVQDGVAIAAVERVEERAAPRGSASAAARSSGTTRCSGRRRRRSQRPSARARSTSASPAGCIAPGAISASALARLTFDHFAARPPRHEALDEWVSSRLAHLRVDPAVAERGLQRLGVRDAGDARAAAGEADPHALGERSSLRRQDGLPRGARGELALRRRGGGAHAMVAIRIRRPGRRRRPAQGLGWTPSPCRRP